MKRLDFDSFSETLAPIYRYILAIALVIIATGIRKLLLPVSSGVKYTTFYPAVIMAFYLGGNGPGIAAILLSSVSVLYFFLPPYYTFELTNESSLQTIMYLVAAGFCGYFVSRMHRYRTIRLNSQEKISEVRLEEANRMFALAAEGARVGIWKHKPTDAFSFNDVFAEHFGLPVGVHAVSYGKIVSIIHPDDRERVSNALKNSILETNYIAIEYRVIWPDGSDHWIYMHGRPMYEADGSLKQIDGETVDISDRKLAEGKYVSNLAMIKTAFASMEEGILIKDNHGNVIEMNYAVAPFFKFSRSDAPKTFSEIEDVFDMFTLSSEPITFHKNPYTLALKGKKGTYELKFCRKDTGETWFGSISSAPIFDEDNKIKGVVITGHDITDRIERQRLLEETVQQRTADLSIANQSLIELSHHDILTGLFNRLACDERLRSEFVRMKRTGDIYCVLMLDIDLFKNVNDSCGHAIGDEVLKFVAETLSKNLREYDFLARWGGEEFLILLPATEFDEAFIVAEKLRFAVEAETHPIAGTVTVSAGVADVSPVDLDEDIAVIRADEGLYEAKNSGRNRVVGKMFSATSTHPSSSA